jgi:endonuclease YncB( thermonuclease family)
VPFLLLKGHVFIRKLQKPDGDTLAFAAASPFSSSIFERGDIPVNTDASAFINLRFQSIDAPEKEQPRGMDSRDHLLGLVGIDPAPIGLGSDFTANALSPLVPAWVATHGFDNFDRLLSYVFTENHGFTHGDEVPADDLLPVLKQTLNYKQVAKGAAYPAFYSNTDENHAAVFQAGAVAARERGATAGGWSVWADDATTTGFIPTPDELGKDGALVYPKFFRRVMKWDNPRPNGRAFINWLKRQSDGKKLVQGAEFDPLPLWKLFVPVGTKKVRVPYDVTKLWFSE